MNALFPTIDLPRLPNRKQVRKAKLASRIIPQWELDDAITVVLFAGLGGACQGLEEAGCPVHVANNHDDVALAAHQALHRHTRHVRGDIFDVDPVQATKGHRVKILWASPDCRDHSVAKGGAPRSARVRSLPWQVCRWAGKTRPAVVFVENVREIRGWGTLVAKRCHQTGRVIKLDGTVAARGERVPVFEQSLVRDDRRQGRSFRRFVAHLRSLGYDYQDRDLNCADYGVPTSRKRYFAVARRDGQPIAWPVRTHAPRHQAAALGLLPHVAASTIIDWSLPLPSIFERKRPLADATHRRIALGLHRYVLNNPTPFLVPITHAGVRRCHPGDELLPTLTTAHRGELAIVAPVLTGCGGRAGQVPRALDLQEPLGTQMAGGAKHGVVAAWMTQHNLGVVGHEMKEPLSTLTTAGTQQNVTAAYFAHLRGTSNVLDATNPVPTITAGGGHVATVAAFMTKYYSSGGQDQACDEPLHTLATKARFSVVSVAIHGVPYVVSDIGMRMLSPHEAAAAHELTLPAAITINGTVRPLTKTECMRLVGNSVPKRMARLLAQANAAHALYSPAASTHEVAA
jgi:DNA (cytosine-5)-methyltransferase 1